AFVFRRLDTVAVKGKAHAIGIHELVGLAEDPAVEAKREVITLYEAALVAARARSFEQALALLADIPSDGPAMVLTQRCRTWIVSPPPTDWDGTWAATSK